MRTFLITGANRGIGLALCKELGNRGHNIIGTVRNMDSAGELKNVAGIKRIECLDVCDEESVKDLAAKFQREKVFLNGIINNAGIFSKKGPNGENLQSSMFDISPELFTAHFQVNAMGPFLVFREFLPLLDRTQEFPIVVTIGSAMGSLEKLHDHRSSYYRVSKCAAHMVTKAFSKEVKDCCFVNIHPGWVKTDMGTEKAPVTVENSASGISDVLDSLALADSGKFYDFNGKELPY